MLAKDGYVAIK